MPTVTSRRTTASLVAAAWIHSTSPVGKVKLHKKFVCMDSVPLASDVGVNTVARLVECSCSTSIVRQQTIVFSCVLRHLLLQLLTSFFNKSRTFSIQRFLSGKLDLLACKNRRDLRSTSEQDGTLNASRHDQTPTYLAMQIRKMGVTTIHIPFVLSDVTEYLIHMV